MAGETFTDIFTPVDGDYALISLRRVMGCTVDQIWTGASCGDAGLIATAAGFFNVAVAIVAGILITYTVWVGIANTAGEGESMGSGTSTKYTVARVGLGAILLLPVSSGFSLAQILVIQLLIWGSGAADNLWKLASSDIVTGGYSRVATLPEDDARLRGMLAGAIRTRALGYLCAMRLNDIATTMGKGTPVSEREVSGAFLFGLNTEPRKRTFTFTDTTGFYNNSNSLCGSVTYSIPVGFEPSEVANSPTGDIDQSMSGAMSEIAVAALNAGLKAGWTSINTTARQIAQAAGSSARNDDQIRQAITSGVDNAQTAIMNGVNSIVNGSGAQINQAAQQYLSKSVEAGWIFAISWQRAAINVYQYFQSALDSVNMQFSNPQSLATLLQPMSQGGWFGGPPQLSGSTWRIISDQYERDVGYLQTFDPFYAEMGKASPAEVGGQVGGDEAAGYIAGAFSAILNAMRVEGDQASVWSDPLLSLVDIGSTLSATGLGLLATATAADVATNLLGWVPGAGTAAGAVIGGAAAAAWALGVLVLGLGFWIGGVLPLAPLLYFFGAAISWLVIGLEALIAVPLWVLSHFFPAREASLIGASRQGYLLLFGLLARPTLIIMGLLASLAVMWASFSILNALFSSVFSLMIPLGGGSVASLILSVAAIFIYGTAATIVVSMSCQLISELGDAALRWIEVGVQSLWGARFGQEAMGPINPSGQVAHVGMRGAGMAGAARSNVEARRERFLAMGADRARLRGQTKKPE